MRSDIESINPTTATTPPWPSQTVADSHPSACPSERLTANGPRVFLTFAGQGVAVFDELAELIDASPTARQLVKEASIFLDRLSHRADLSRAGDLHQGFDPLRWCVEPASRPGQAYLASSPVSQPSILLCQAARYATTLELGLREAVLRGGVAATTGHSQGIMASVLAAETGAGPVSVDRLCELLEWMTLQGVHMARSFREAVPERGPLGATAMASVSGPDQRRLQAMLEGLNAKLSQARRPVIALENTRTRFVLSGPPSELEVVRLSLVARATKEAAAKKLGRFAGPVGDVSWEYLDVAAAYHSPSMQRGLDAMSESVSRLGLKVDTSRFAFPIVSVGDGEVLSGGDVTEPLLRSQFLQSVRWSAAVRTGAALPGVSCVVDCGPGDGVSLLTRSVLRGSGVHVYALSRAEERRAFFTPGESVTPPPVRYADSTPTRIEVGIDRQASAPRSDPQRSALQIDNRFSRLTGTPPIFLAGMTPTTSEAPIVVAAANAGFTAELAGGGQVSERIFWLRMEELAEHLEPGRGFIFNALFLDPYLWDLHLRKAGLVKKARRQGFPIDGVTISAGLPEVEDAVALLDELADLGMKVNAFKPGTLAQIEQVARIAKAAPHHQIYVHIEGGKAGGHHSWEDLDALLLGGYGRLRELPNLVICAGGGIGTPEAALERLSGTWAHRHGQSSMPVDAVFLGTRAMACLEACTSSHVKQALVDAAGSNRWVYAGAQEGGVTSGKSSLNADIYYLENEAAKTSRLLDAVAGDPAAIAARKDELVAALNRTSKPYFGDVAGMTYAAVLERLISLLAVGRFERYDDGPFADPTYRTRIADLVWLTETRLSSGSKVEVDSVLSDLTDLDRPMDVVERLFAQYPEGRTLCLHPDDARAFVRDICDRPGKPVCFVAAIDAEVRRRFKSDSLWQSHDERYPADSVLSIPGPEAVMGITRANESVVEILEAFVSSIVTQLPPGHGPGQAPDRPLGSPPKPIDALSAFLVAPFVTVSGRRRPNPVLALISQEPGAKIERTTDADGRLSALVFLPARGSDKVELKCTGPNLEITLRVADAALTFAYAAKPHGDAYRFVATDEAKTDVTGFYHQALFGESLAPVAPFEAACQPCSLTVDEVADYRAQLDLPYDPDGHVPLPMLFSLVWRPLMRTLSAPTFGAALLRLLHRSVRAVPGPGWPLRAAEVVDVSARVHHVSRIEAGLKVETTCTATRSIGGRVELVATVVASFVLRDLQHPELLFRTAVDLDFNLSLDDEEKVAFVSEREGLVFRRAPVVGERLRFVGRRDEERLHVGPTTFAAKGTIEAGGLELGTFDLRSTTPSRDAEAPIDVLRSLLSRGSFETSETVETPGRTLGEGPLPLPHNMEPFAAASRDRNPIHTSSAAARLAGFDGPIVHGMYTAARLYAGVVSHAAKGVESRVRAFEVSFDAPALPGEDARLVVRRAHVRSGTMVCESLAIVRRLDEDVIVARATAEVAPNRTAYAFPGQGIQRRGMGMEAYARSAAVRSIWDRADTFTRGHLGFSILTVVRENPTALLIDGELRLHPAGVLHSTELTQVAMAVLAQAQVAELREAGVFVEDAITCGHSIGEYNAISAVTEVLPLESVIAIVYARGCTMHRMVPRDAHGESGYRMGVIRPNLAGLDHAAAEALVSKIAQDTGRFLEIVNYNVRGRQYSVTGHTDALSILERELAGRGTTPGKPPYIEVPGIDVPFHSTALRDGVADFRAVLDGQLPLEIDPARLVGRYIPNLVGRVFELSRSFFEAVLEETHSPALLAVRDDFEAMPQAAITRLLLIELLAWQFASPVRWIDTQDVLGAAVSAGGLGVERFIEVGVGYQPTLVGMARQSLGADVVVLNIEADRDRVFELDADERAAAPELAPEALDDVLEDSPDRAPSPAQALAQTVDAATPPPPDQALTAADAARILLAWQARTRPEQVRCEVGRDETIDELFGGVSSRRNQVLLDLGAELGTGPVDGAHERPLSTLLPELGRRAASYAGPGKYLRTLTDDAQKRVFGRAGLTRAELLSRAESVYGLGAGLRDWLLLSIAVESREGASTRGGPLGNLSGRLATKAGEVEAVLDAHVAALGVSLGLALGRRVSAAKGVAVDAEALRALEARLVGRDGVLTGLSADLVERLRKLSADEAPKAPELDLSAVRLASLRAELGAEWEEATRPAFDAKKLVVFASTWANAQRDVARLALLPESTSEAAVALEVSRLSAHADDPRISDTARFYADRAQTAGKPKIARALETLANRPAVTALNVPDLAPRQTLEDDGTLRLFEVERNGVPSTGRPPLSLKSRSILVTGASPGSIAIEAVRHLLRGGARVFLTTSTYTPERLAFYRRLHQDAASPGAELHVVPFNQAALRDVDALVDWLGSEITESAGATVRIVKRPDHIDAVLPFAALKDSGTLDTLGARSDVALRAMLTAVERLVACFAKAALAQGVGSRPTHFVLPLSPNVGGFGGDGTYAESKAGLEALVRKHTSEYDAWGHAVTFTAARIGWVRGTGLMDQNDALAFGLESQADIRTFSSAEMGHLIAELCTDEARARARSKPELADLTGGLGDIAKVKPVIDQVRAALDRDIRGRRRATALRQAWASRTAPSSPRVKIKPAVDLTLRGVGERPSTVSDFPRPGSARLEDTVVIVGTGEVGPFGSARTRHEIEVDGRLSDAGVLELAWTTGLVRYDDTGKGAWIDVVTGAPVPEAALGERYRDAVMARIGIRFIEPSIAGFDPESMPVYTTAILDRDFTFDVSSAQEAQSFVAADPEHTRVLHDVAGERFRVTRTAGSEIRLPRRMRVSRRVAGQLPTGFDPLRAGVPADMAESVDRLALYNLIATADAFLSAGLTPEELVSFVHPTRIGNSQGAGMGGMRSLQRLYIDAVLDRERQSDALQETLINVAAGYVVQSYVGSYGPMIHPVAACATAAVSLEVGADMIRLGKADFVVAGGYDDLSREGAQGFADMNATADTDEMLSMGLLPSQMSRANDVRRRGFVEAQGGGTVLLARGDVAARLGLPVQAVLAYAGSFSDGVQRSVPAPGLGVIAAAMGGSNSPLGLALQRHGLTADDIALVYKHDTSTGANDPNENLVHQSIQTALSRTKGNPLWVVSQKTLTGHSKGGAAAWQTIGLCQTLVSGSVPGNRNLDHVDPAMRAYDHIGFTDRTLPLGQLGPLRAGLLTSLGFGHVGGIALLLHPDAFEILLDDEVRLEWRAASERRRVERSQMLGDIFRGRRSLFERRGHRRFEAHDGSAAQSAQEVALLLTPEARLDPTTQHFVTSPSDPRRVDRS